MKTIEKYSESLTSWIAKIMFAAANNAGKCAYFHDENTNWDYYTDNYCAYGIPECLNICKTESRHIIQLSDKYLHNIPYREIYNTNMVENYAKPYNKKPIAISIFKDADGKETAVNSGFLKILDKYPFPVKFVQESTLSAVYVIDINNDFVVAILMPINRNTLK